MENDGTDNDHQDTIDRLGLLLISQPREGWEKEFEEIKRRLIERVYGPFEERERDE